MPKNFAFSCSASDRNRHMPKNVACEGSEAGGTAAAN
jgi:hypothetical protein